MMGVVEIVVIERYFQFRQRLLVLFALVGNNRESIANRVKNCFLGWFQFGSVVFRSSLQKLNSELAQEKPYPVNMQRRIYRTIVIHRPTWQHISLTISPGRTIFLSIRAQETLQTFFGSYYPGTISTNTLLEELNV